MKEKMFYSHDNTEILGNSKVQPKPSPVLKSVVWVKLPTLGIRHREFRYYSQVNLIIFRSNLNMSLVTSKILFSQNTSTQENASTRNISFMAQQNFFKNSIKNNLLK